MSEDSGHSKLFCFGYGYVCDYLTNALRQEGNWDIAGTTRDNEKRRFLRAERKVEAYLFDYEKPLADPLYFLKDVTHLLISTPPADAGDPSFLMHGIDITKLENLKWVGYLSTIGVYGDRNGEWVDEESEIRPSSKRGSRRAKSEAQWMSLFRDMGVPVHIFRLAGIYGPGRSALDTVKTGAARRVDKPGHAFNRIYINDLVKILKASIDNPNAGNIYNVADDRATPSHEVIEYACNLLDIEVPPLQSFSQADLAPIARSFYKDNKRVHNDKIKQDLGVSLDYPDYKSGLDHCLELEG